MFFYFNDELIFTNVYCINYVNSWDTKYTQDGHSVVFMFGQNEEFAFEFKEEEDACKFIKMFKNLMFNEKFIDLKKLLKRFCDEENINYLVGFNYEC